MKKLEELFNLPPHANTEPDDVVPDMHEPLSDLPDIRALDTALDKIDAALPTVADLEASDKEMDSLAALATEKFEELMNLGMNVDSRFSGTIFQTAGQLLGHAITAKQAKIDKKLRMVELQLKKANLDLRAQKTAGENPAASAIDGAGVVVDRNEILRSIIDGIKEQPK
jgi:hypothetical protein